ncbi:hypothetical protein V6N12_073822 [Hibiscus sabdariffa]
MANCFSLSCVLNCVMSLELEMASQLRKMKEETPCNAVRIPHPSAPQIRLGFRCSAPLESRDVAAVLHNCFLCSAFDPVCSAREKPESLRGDHGGSGKGVACVYPQALPSRTARVV